MNTSELESVAVNAITVMVSDDTLTVELSDGRSVAAPLVWFPRLLHGTNAERTDYRLIGQGSGIHWPQLDEDISVNNLLQGKRSQESQVSLKRWLEQRQRKGERGSAVAPPQS